MPKLTVRRISETYLELDNPESGLYSKNHIFEPEYHQAEYAGICEELSNQEGAFQLGKSPLLMGSIRRGTQPKYADNETDSETLCWLGMTDRNGVVIGDETANVCALKSICVRDGYIDLETARSVSKETYKKTMNKAGVQKNDILINSTGDGTIGRVAVFNHDFPAVVDGHITIVRLNDANVAWYVAAFLMSPAGQNQLYRYINGSSGQVEIYPQDIARVWIKMPGVEEIKQVASDFKGACDSYIRFKQDIRKALSKV